MKNDFPKNQILSPFEIEDLLVSAINHRRIAANLNYPGKKFQSQFAKATEGLGYLEPESASQFLLFVLHLDLRVRRAGFKSYFYFLVYDVNHVDFKAALSI